MTRQTTIPGAEPITDAQLAQRRADMPLRPKVPQQPLECGLFGDGHLQLDLVEMLMDPTNEE